MSWTCPLCKRVFFGEMAKAQHSKNFYKQSNDPLRCDNKTSDSDSDFGLLSDRESDGESNDATGAAAAGARVASAIISPMHFLASRPAANIELERRERYRYQLKEAKIPAGMFPRDMVHVMQLWQHFKTNTLKCCTDKFWRFFLRLHDLSGVAIDAALRGVKDEFLDGAFGTDSWNRFPGSKRTLLSKMSAVKPRFWPHVSHTVRIDVSKFGLPKRLSHFDFKFIDPVFGWMIAARRQRADEMHWQPTLHANADGDPMYGRGVQHGKAFAEACRSCPPGWYGCC